MWGTYCGPETWVRIDYEARVTPEHWEIASMRLKQPALGLSLFAVDVTVNATNLKQIGTAVAPRYFDHDKIRFISMSLTALG